MTEPYSTTRLGRMPVEFQGFNRENEKRLARAQAAIDSIAVDLRDARFTATVAEADPAVIAERFEADRLKARAQREVADCEADLALNATRYNALVADGEARLAELQGQPQSELRDIEIAEVTAALRAWKLHDLERQRIAARAATLKGSIG